MHPLSFVDSTKFAMMPSRASGSSEKYVSFVRIITDMKQCQESLESYSNT